MSKRVFSRRARDLLLGLALLCAALALLFFPKEAMAAVKEGLLLCYNVILPSLFPFFVLSTLVVDLGLARYLGRLLERVMRPLFRVGGVCASALVLGFIGGYPVGARTTIDLYEKGLCSRVEAERLLAFCNNSGPAFILGVVGAGVFSSSRVGLLLCLAHAAASVCVGLLFRFYGRAPGKASVPGPSPCFQASRFTTAFTGAVKTAFQSTLNICAFVVLFTVVIRLLFLSGVLPGAARLLSLLLGPFGLTRSSAEHLLTGIIELSSGIWTLSGEGALATRLPMAAFLLGWAGLSVHCQTLSFVGSSGLSAHTYLLGKLLHGLLSAGFMALLTRLLPMDTPVFGCLNEQIAGIAGQDFSSALAGSTICAWVVFLFFLLAAAVCLRKNLGKQHGSML